jgi:hypothetical protein
MDDGRLNTISHALAAVLDCPTLLPLGEKSFDDRFREIGEKVRTAELRRKAAIDMPD